MPARSRARAARVVAVVVLSGLAATLAACGDGSAADPSLSPGPQASSTACTLALAELPTSVLGQSRRGVAVDGIARWGSPAIVLGCGHRPPGPSTQACLSVDDVDWLVEDPAADPVRFTTYGRSPALVVLVPSHYGRDQATGALADLAAVAGALARSGPGCS